MRFAHKVQQVVIAHVVFREQHHMIQTRLHLRADFGIFGKVNFASVDGLDLLAGFFFHRLARIAQLGHTAHDAMVGNSHGGHVKIRRTAHHVFNFGGTVEHGIFGMVMQMDESHAALPLPYIYEQMVVFYNPVLS